MDNVANSSAYTKQSISQGHNAGDNAAGTSAAAARKVSRTLQQLVGLDRPIRFRSSVTLYFANLFMSYFVLHF